MATNPIIATIQTTGCLALNVAVATVRTLVRRGLISNDDAVRILNEIAQETLSDCETPEELEVGQTFADWLKQAAEDSYAPLAQP